ncbi:hypothetical protein AB0L88_14400 [Saccharopolyspora shandongensis]|uniref:Cas10/Cmr2 second palm domain-containing protein n=1 Tax=Saccharopolyspora shandongensis TaxID=418495 RepID=UPI00342FD732
MTRQFLDVGVVQIQAWLARTPKLQGRRGASTLISQVSDPDAIRQVLPSDPDLAKINDEAGRIDGVVALELADSSKETATTVERVVVDHIRQQLPGVSLSVSRYSGETYEQARSAQAHFSREWPAPAADWPPGRPCQWCSTWPATPDKQDAEGNKLCAECVERREAAGSAKSRRAVPFPEQELLRRLGINGEPAIPDEFDQLTSLEGETHLALVYADGNAIGAFIKRYLGRKRKRKNQLNIAKTIDDATWESLVDAVRDISGEDEAHLPVVPHLVGGDDVLVSVPASRAWRFTRTLLTGFGARMESTASEFGVGTIPSLSAGVVFHHYQLPLFLLQELAKAQLRHAKVHTAGGEASIAWQDTTRDGHNPISRPALTLRELTDHWQALRTLRDLPASARHRVDELVRAHGPGSAELEAHKIRMGIADELAPFGQSIAVADAIGMTKWWS